MVNPTPIWLLYAGLYGAIVASAATLLLVIYLNASELHRRAIWAEDATMSGKFKTYVNWIIGRTDWRDVAVVVLPRAIVIGSALAIVALVFGAGLYHIFGA